MCVCVCFFFFGGGGVGLEWIGTKKFNKTKVLFAGVTFLESNYLTLQATGPKQSCKGDNPCGIYLFRDDGYT